MTYKAIPIIGRIGSDPSVKTTGDYETETVLSLTYEDLKDGEFSSLPPEQMTLVTGEITIRGVVHYSFTLDGHEFSSDDTIQERQIGEFLEAKSDLIELVDSPELRRYREQHEEWNTSSVRHYKVFCGDYGAFSVLASGVEVHYSERTFNDLPPAG